MTKQWLRQTGGRSKGVTATETALMIPVVFLFLIYAVQLGLYLVSHQVVQYAAYMAARSYLVYGRKTLGDIRYPYTASAVGGMSSGGLKTNDRQSVAEATAEKIIFESLPWEHARIDVVNKNDWYMQRVYIDGVDEGRSASQNGAVRVDFNTNPAIFNLPGVKVTYCMPALFPFPTFEGFFSKWGDDNPCTDMRPFKGFKTKVAIPVRYSYYLGREPV